MNTDELLAKRANLQRIKDFAQQLKVYNKTTQDPTKRTLEGEKAHQLQIARNFQESKVVKAAEFAKHVPKPKSCVPNKVVKSNLDKAKSSSIPVHVPVPACGASISSVYREKYLVQGTKQRYEQQPSSECRDDDEYQSYHSTTNQATSFHEPCDHSPTRLELLESKYKESQRQVESIKQSFRK